MNLTYSILWFDDTDEVFNSLDLEPIQKKFTDWGFEPSFKLITSPDDFMREAPFSEFDLIVIDFNLSEYDKHGDEFIELIRSNNVFTEIVFYSGQPASELWDAIRGRELEGVYIANRSTVTTKIEQVAKQSVKKVLDLPNMRGIVMAEVGDIDLLLDSILEKGVQELGDDEKQTIFKKFYEQVHEQHKKQGSKLDDFKKEPTPSGMLEMCDTYKRWLSLKRLLKAHPALTEEGIGDYNEDIIKPRNHLAHGKPSKTEDGYQFEYGGKNYLFSDEAGQNLRINIRRYKSKFVGISQLLGKK
jgi:hypothetical protein